jgi:hypothetical protein
MGKAPTYMIINAGTASGGASYQLLPPLGRAPVASISAELREPAIGSFGSVEVQPPAHVPDGLLPTRYTSLIEIRKKHGSRADKVAAYFMRGDPPADDVVAELTQLPPTHGAKMFDAALEQGIAAVPQAPKALRTLFGQVEEVPLWVNHELLDMGSRTVLRCGIVAGIVLGCSALPLAYRSAGGTKALMFSQQCLMRSVRRLSETNRFFIETCAPGGMEVRAPGWKITLKVRLMHAQMRRLLGQSKNKPWKTANWGVPINQVDLAATQLLFSVNLLTQLRRVGFHFSPAESEGVMHLWRYAGHLLGIVPELIAATEAEGRKLRELILDVTGGPDEDSLRLTESLMKTAMPIMMAALIPWLMPGTEGHGKSPGWLARMGGGLAERLGLKLRPQTYKKQLAHICYGLSHNILGNEIASELRYPATHWRYSAPAVLRMIITPLEWLRRLVPGATGLAFRAGQRQIERLKRSELFARRPSFRPPA